MKITLESASDDAKKMTVMNIHEYPSPAEVTSSYSTSLVIGFIGSSLSIAANKGSYSWLVGEEVIEERLFMAALKS